jgi:hypothetical protein
MLPDSLSMLVIDFLFKVVYTSSLNFKTSLSLSLHSVNVADTFISVVQNHGKRQVGPLVSTVHNVLVPFV